METLRNYFLIALVFGAVMLVDQFTGKHIITWLSSYESPRDENGNRMRGSARSKMIRSAINAATDDGSVEGVPTGTGDKVFKTDNLFGSWKNDETKLTLVFNKDGSCYFDDKFAGEFQLPSGLKYSHSTSFTVNGSWSFDGTYITMKPSRLSNVKYADLKIHPPQAGDPQAGKIKVPSKEELAKQLPADISKRILADLAKHPPGGKVPKSVYTTLHLEASNGKPAKYSRIN